MSETAGASAPKLAAGVPGDDPVHPTAAAPNHSAHAYWMMADPLDIDQFVPTGRRLFQDRACPPTETRRLGCSRESAKTVFTAIFSLVSCDVSLFGLWATRSRWGDRLRAAPRCWGGSIEMRRAASRAFISKNGIPTVPRPHDGQARCMRPRRRTSLALGRRVLWPSGRDSTR